MTKLWKYIISIMLSAFKRFIKLFYGWMVPIMLVFTCSLFVRADEIERFEHLNSRDGLSQNSVLSIYCDNKGYIWMGTMDGLNRYDGYTFRVLKAEPGKANTLTNNRVSRIWEDSLHFIWLNTYDGYVHWYNPAREDFRTIPFYYQSDEEKNSHFTTFYQENKNEIWLGTSNSGLYYLNYDSVQKDYTVAKYLSRGIISITNNEIHFVIKDRSNTIWIGTKQGLNMLEYYSRELGQVRFQHYLIDLNFTVAATMDNYVWFGTRTNGIKIYNCQTRDFMDLPDAFKVLDNEEITILKVVNKQYLVIGTATRGLFIYDIGKTSLFSYKFNGKYIHNVYEDVFHKLWINTEHFGITYLDPHTGYQEFYQLTPSDLEPLVDDERQYFFEDSDNNLWIGLHGAGLALFDRTSAKFRFYRNNPDDPYTISSNFVHCITQDKSGILWIGTGQINGGANKAVPANPLFQQIVPMKNVKDMADNVIRCVFEDRNNIIWAATKSGNLYMYDSSFTVLAVLKELPLEKTRLPGYNIYSIAQDSEGYLWLGSKGGGIAVSVEPLQNYQKGYKEIKFRLYQHDVNDSSSLSNNNIYSIIEDRQKNIWIGTYGGGLNLVMKRTNTNLYCRRFNISNSTLSVNDIRNIFQDSKGRIWIATTFGLNLMKGNEQNQDSIVFRAFTYEPLSDSSISYNDIVHIFESNDGNIWFATFGGGLNKLSFFSEKAAIFQHYNHTNGLVNDAIFGILQDELGNLWLSTERGISKFNPVKLIFDNYDQDNGLKSDRFSENTCIALNNGRLLFGSTGGILAIDPKKIVKESYIPPVVFTNFQLFNKDVDIHNPDAPFHEAIEYLNRIVLKYYQSSFSIEYAALSYFDPHKNTYQFRLVGFEEDWNDIGNLTRATYTNVSSGKYEFQVRASGWDGSWNSIPRTILITILPPWYHTIWAYILYGIIFIILIEITRRVLTRFNRMRRDLLVERRVNDIKLQFFTNVSHEIRTPLTLILGPLADIKAHTKLPASLKRSIEIMDFNGKRMLRLVNQLLDFRKIQKNKMRLKIQEIEIVQFVREVIENFNPLAKEKHIHFNFHTEIDFMKVWADPDQLDSVLYNVLSNAFKFTQANKLIEVYIGQLGKEYVEILCNDEGKGIPKEKIPVLFQRYTPLSGIDVNYQGTGIGLALSYEIMKLHGGEIDVKSEEGKGSKFFIRIRLGNTHFDKDDLSEEENQVTERHHRKLEEYEKYEESQEFDDEFVAQKPVYCILLVEDNEDIVAYVEHILESSYKVVVAKNGIEALNIIKTTHPDLIITDVMMPKMDGIELTLKIKDNFETSHIPVVMLTAKSQIEDQIHGIESGAEAYILKPFNANYLRAVVLNMLRQREIIMKRFFDQGSMPDGIKITTKDEKFMQDVLVIIKKNYSNSEFNVEKLVDISTVGRTVFYNKIKGLTGIAPVEFLRNMRLKIASNLIIDSGYNVSEVGYMSGFNDIKYFSKCFKSHFGMTPTKFKHKYASETGKK